VEGNVSSGIDEIRNDVVDTKRLENVTWQGTILGRRHTGRCTRKRLHCYTR
jgi:hypothetical protein